VKSLYKDAKRLAVDAENISEQIKLSDKNVIDAIEKLRYHYGILRIHLMEIRSLKVKTIMIDPGHGGDKDNGAVYGYTDEDDINLSIAYLLRYELQLQGYSVAMTRERDEEISLGKRVIFANEMKADLFVSIHCDAFHKNTAQGMTVHVSPNCSATSRDVANAISKSLHGKFPTHRDRGIKRSNFEVIRETDMPAVLIECEFLSNQETRRFLKEPENQLDLAKAIAQGIKREI